MTCEIEPVDNAAFMAACLMHRWSRKTGENPETWGGFVRAKWIAMAFEQKQYDFKEVDPYV